MIADRTRPGLFGIAGIAGVREVVVAVEGNERAQLAFDVLVRGISGAVAAMTTSMRGLDALVFSPPGRASTAHSCAPTCANG